MNFDEKIQLQVLKLKEMSRGITGPLLDQLLEEAGEAKVRQMCAKVSHELYDDLERTCQLLDMTKREFIEAAVAEALVKAHEVIDRSGVMEQLELSTKEGK
jgi:L-amino acid N-acyltransferase YncA